MTFKEGIELAGRIVEAVGVGVLLLGVAAVLLAGLAKTLGKGDLVEAYRRSRKGLGRVILLGLEILVAGDIIATVAVEPSLTSVAVLAGIVLIRTFLSWAIEVEAEGRLPWRPRSSESAR